MIEESNKFFGMRFPFEDFSSKSNIQDSDLDLDPTSKVKEGFELLGRFWSDQEIAFLQDSITERTIAEQEIKYQQIIEDLKNDIRFKQTILENINNELSRYTKEINKAKQKWAYDCANIALEIAKKINHSLNKNLFAKNLEALITSNIRSLDGESIKLYLSSDIISYFDKFEIQGVNFQALEDQSLSCGDYRIEWDDGAISRNVQAIYKQVDDLITNYKENL